MEVYPMGMPWDDEEFFEENFETIVVGDVVLDTLMCGVFDVVNILKNLRVLDQ